MSYEDRANARPNLDESDVEEETMVNDYREQVNNYDDGMSDLDRTTSQGGAAQDLQAQLAAAATPLEYQATLETKFASYDNYCSLFHYILNSDGPVELEVPSVGLSSPETTPLLGISVNENKTLGISWIRQGQFHHITNISG